VEPIVKNRTLAALFGLAALLSSCSDQPKVRCAAARGQFAASYKLVSGSGDCSTLPGDMLGVGTYNSARADGTPNWDDATIAIQPYALAALTAGAPPAMAGDSLFSLGHFTAAEPNADRFCEVPQLSAAQVRLPAVTMASVDAMGNVTCPGPAQDVKYVWSNVRVVVSAAVLGTELAADLTYTANGCTAQYRVWAVSPAVSCAGPIPEVPPDDAGADGATADVADARTSDVADSRAADVVVDASADSAASAGNDAGPNGSDATGTADGGGTDGGLPPACTEPPAVTPAPPLDPTLCSPYPNLEKNRPLGSGLNPDSLITCDPATFFCVLARDPGR
jgi:hypothetical protein